MWKAPADAVRDERKARARRAFRGGDADLDEDFGVDVVGERAALERSAKRGGLEYETGVSAVVVDDEDDEDKADREEEEEWLGFDVSLPFFQLLSRRGADRRTCSRECGSRSRSVTFARRTSEQFFMSPFDNRTPTH